MKTVKDVLEELQQVIQQVIEEQAKESSSKQALFLGLLLLLQDEKFRKPNGLELMATFLKEILTKFPQDPSARVVCFLVTEKFQHESERQAILRFAKEFGKIQAPDSEAARILRKLEQAFTDSTQPVSESKQESTK